MNRRAYGLRDWLLQRISAVYLALYLLLFLAAVIIAPPHSYKDWRGWMAGPWFGMATVLFFIALLIHAWVGVRDVIMDYVHPVAVRLLLLSLVAGVLLGSLFGVMATLAEVLA